MMHMMCIMSSLLNIYQNFAHISKNIEFSKIVWKAKFYWNINMHANKMSCK